MANHDTRLGSPADRLGLQPSVALSGALVGVPGPFDPPPNRKLVTACA